MKTALFASFCVACFVGGAIGFVLTGAKLQQVINGHRVPPGRYLLHQWRGSNFSPNLDASIHEFMPFDDSKFEAGDTAVEVDENGRWHLIPSA